MPTNIVSSVLFSVQILFLLLDDLGVLAYATVDSYEVVATVDPFMYLTAFVLKILLPMVLVLSMCHVWCHAKHSEADGSSINGPHTDTRTFVISVRVDIVTV